MSCLLTLLCSASLAVGLAVGAAEVPAGAEGNHTVRSGETLGEIAAANGISATALASANRLANPNRILAGQVLVIPGATASTPATVLHVVAPGESLSTIAAHYGTTTTALADANGITNRNLVRIGQRLTVPAGSGASAPTNTSYTVAHGETLAVIAHRFGTSVGAIVAANGISDPNVVRAGQVLTIPAGTGGTSGGGSSSGSDGASGGSTSTSAYGETGGSDGRTGVAGTHTVGHGETLTGIAAAAGITPADLAAANGIPRPWNVYAGARLFLSAPNRLPVDIAECPVPGATFVNDWGYPRDGHAHEGNDMMAPRGTAILAPVGGTVSFATGSIGGKQFHLQGDDGMLYIGSHMTDFGHAGRVERGAIIGYVGNTGNAAGGATHLHFEIHPDGGAAMNPFPVITAAC